MAKVLERMKNIFKKNPRPQNLPPGSYPNSVGNAATLGTITKPTYQMDDDDDEDIESLGNYNVKEQTRLRGQSRDTFQSSNINPRRNSFDTTSTPIPGSFNPPNTQFRGTSSGFTSGLSTNNNMNPSPNTNTGTAPNLPSRPAAPFLSQTQDSSSQSAQNSKPIPPNNPQPPFSGFPPGTGSNQPPPPPLPPIPLPNNSQPSFGGFPPGMNLNPTPPPPNNSQPSFGGFPPGMNLNPTPPPPNNSQPASGGFSSGTNFNQTQSPANNSQSHSNQIFPGMNTNQTSPPSTTPNPQSSFPPSNLQTNGSNNPINSQQGTFSSFRNQSNNIDDNLSRLELDYPIENVLIDANIPSAMARKINDVVEQDRFGNAHRIHRYTFESSEPQHISLNNNQHFAGGTRHIREISTDHHNPSFDNRSHPHRPHKHSRQRHHHYSESSLDQYINQLLHAPGSTVIQAQNSNDLQRILNQQLSQPHIFPAQSSLNTFQSNPNSLTGPVFYYTAQALYDDPMRNY